MKPTLSWDTFARGTFTEFPSILDSGSTLQVTSGRVAIALALQRLGVGPGDRVLVPAYHCTAMIEPIVWLGALPRFYRIEPSTEIDLDDLDRKVDAGTRALIVVHYFGFPQKMPSVRAFCDSRGLSLLEDCAHAFFGRIGGRAPGAYGDYAIASAMKFFPAYDGGCLVSSKHPLDQLETQSGGWMFELKAALNSIEYAVAYRRLRPLPGLLRIPLRAKDLLWKLLKRSSASISQRNAAPSASEGGYTFDPRWLHTRMSYGSRLVLTRADRRRIVAQRRRNYQLFLEGAQRMPGARPLFAALPPDVVPYVFPLLVDDPTPIFGRLKQLRVPVLRFGEVLWPGVDTQVCAVAVDYARRLLQFPCHQDLSTQDVHWMIEQLRTVLNNQ